MSDMPSQSPAPSATPPAPLREMDPLDRIGLRTMAGDLRDWMLDRLKHDHHPLPWHMRNQDEQRRAIDQAETAAQDLTRRLFELATGREQPTLVATLKQQKRKGEVIAFEAQIRSSDPLRHAACDCVGREVLLVLAASDDMMGDRGKPKVTADQKALFPDGDGEDGDPVFDNAPNGGR